MKSAAAVLAPMLTVLIGLVGAATNGSNHPPYVPKLQKEGDVIRHPTWGVEVTIPNFEYWKDNSMQTQANYILGAHSNGECGLNLTMFVENDKDGATPEECRRGYMGNPETLRKKREVHLIEESVSPLTYTLFNQTWSSAGLQVTENQLYGYWTRGNLCFELHMSSVECRSATFAAQAMPILRSVKIGKDTGATLETVDLALRGGPDPMGWESHMLAGGLYLHMTKPPDPGRARKFYEEALRMGGDAIPPEFVYVVEAGIGIAWLSEDRGPEAISHLEQALDAARRTPVMEGPDKPRPKADPIEETVYNLTCALSLAGDTAAACARARELLTPLDENLRREKLKQFRKDKQLRPLLKSDCFDALRKDFGLD